MDGKAKRKTWWQRFKAAFKLPRKLKFTREGKYLFFITLGIGFAAINTGNNLLFLLLGMLLSLIIASGILSEISLRKLDVNRIIPKRLFARQPHLIQLEVTNYKRFLPSYSIEVEDILADKPMEKRCYFLKIPARRSQNTSYRNTFLYRGLHHFDGFSMSTQFPFGFFRKSKNLKDPDEMVVYPAIVDISSFTADLLHAMGDVPSRRVGQRGDFYGIREFRTEDDPRQIHWRSTAKRGALMVREEEELFARQIYIALDNAIEKPDDPKFREERELAVSQAASLALHFGKQGFRVGLNTRHILIPDGDGITHLDKILYALALLVFISNSEAPPMKTPPAMAFRIDIKPGMRPFRPHEVNTLMAPPAIQATR